MKKKRVPVVEPIGKQIFHVNCPHCGIEYCFRKGRQTTERSDCFGEGYYRTIEHMRENAVCDVCKKEFTIDFGESLYTIYDPPVRKNTFQECLAKYESKWEYDFEIVITDIPEDNSVSFTVVCENKDYSFLLFDPFDEDLYVMPHEILELGKANADTELYPK